MVSTRFAGLDGVTLESAKIADALRRQGHDLVWFAGELGPGFEPGVVAPSAFFATPDNLRLEAQAFGDGVPERVREEIAAGAAILAGDFRAFLDRYESDVVVVQNAWAIPMQFPLAVALADVVIDRSIPTIGHHHDFAWERERFSSTVVPEVLDAVFPPVGDTIAHIVINQDARDELAVRRHVDAGVLPNVMDFATGPPPSDGGAHFRNLCGVGGEVVLLLQPTRVIRRKGIELTIDLAARIGPEVVVVVTHPDDLDDAYWAELLAQAASRQVDLRLIDAGRERASLASAYAAADLVCFPSLYEGYGNALVEAMFFRRPILVNRYSVYQRDIAPLGVAAIEIDGSVSDSAVTQARMWIEQPASAVSAIERNAQIGLDHLSYETVVDAYGRAVAEAAHR